MHIERLEAVRFRNLAPLALELTAAPVVLVGDNAQGKTNLLEGLALCATGRSFRHARPEELIRHGEPGARLAARFVRAGVRHDVEVELAPRHRGLRVDGRHVRQSTSLLELVNVVSFFPDDLRIAKGSPEERRRFLDRAIANHRPDFVAAALAYAKALKSRNALVRAPTPPERRLLEVFDEELVRYGALVHACRSETLQALAPLATARFADIMRAESRLELELASGAPGEGAFGEQLRAALARSYARDRSRGMTTVGPHRADLLMRVGGRDARTFASQGQQRAIVLALKLAELEYLKGRLGAAPILLLDDVSSELDPERTRAFFAAVAALESQVWVSTTGAAALPLPGSAQVLRVRDGRLDRD